VHRLSHKKLTGREFAREVAEYTAALRREIEASVEGFAPDDAARARRTKRAAGDFRFFAKTYFPHYVTRGEAATHGWLYDNLPRRIDAAGGTRTAVAAPRGEGKSTIVSLQLVLWCVVTGRKHYMLMICDVFEQAATLLGAVKAEVESNPRLAADWPEAMGAGAVWRDGVVVTKNNIKIQARGAGQRVRGLRHGPHRPDLVIGDDLENDTNVKTIEQRHKLARWWRQAVLYLGPPDGSMDVIVIGTILHYDSLLAGLLKAGRWNGKKFRSIIRWPARMDLWDKFTEQVGAGDADGAAEFYRRRKKTMDAGAEVSWLDAQPLLQLMLERAESPGDFAVEKQNEPGAADDAVFAGAVCFWDKRPADMVTFGCVDPSLGKNSRSDPSAILVGGVERGAKKRILYVLAASIRRRTPDKIIDDVITLQRAWKCAAWAVEAVQFQEYFRQQVLDKSIAAGEPVPARAVTPHTDKALRIESLQPFLAGGRILLRRDQVTLREQLEHYPHTDHDDGPDALHMLWQLTAGLAWRDPAGAVREAERPTAGIRWGEY